jgi:hypothetical protein
MDKNIVKFPHMFVKMINHYLGQANKCYHILKNGYTLLVEQQQQTPNKHLGLYSLKKILTTKRNVLKHCNAL